MSCRLDQNWEKAVGMGEQTSLFETSYGQLHGIRIEGNLTVSLVSSSLSQENSSNSFGIFHAKLVGPYILMYKNDEKVHKFFIFTPHYFYRVTSRGSSLEMIPINPSLTKTILLSFPSESSAFSWSAALRQVDLFVTSFSSQKLYISIPVNIHADDKCQRYQLGFEAGKIELLQQEQEHGAEGMEQLKPQSISLIVDSKFDLLPLYETANCPEKLVPFSFSLCTRKLSKQFIECLSEDHLFYSFLTLFLAANKLKMDGIKGKSEDLRFASRIPSRELTESWISPPFLSSIGTKPAQINAQALLNFQAKSFLPPKGSTDLELLAFDMPISRRLFIIAQENKKMGHISFVKPLELPPELPLTRELINIRLSLKDAHYSVRFQAKCQSFSDNARKGRKETVNFSHPLQGSSVAQRASSIVVSINDSYSFGDQNVLDLCSLIASVLMDKTNGSIIPQITNLCAGFANLSECLCNRNFSDFHKIVIFVFRMFMNQSYPTFFELTIASPKWRADAYSKFALMGSPQFIELLEASILPMKWRKCTGGCTDEVVNRCKQGFLLETTAEQIRQSTDRILESSKMEDVGQINSHVVKIVELLCAFFTCGFAPLIPSPLPQLRHCWYIFLIAKDTNSMSTEMIAYRKAVDDISLAGGTPEMMTKRLLLSGIKLGMISSWVRLLANIARDEGLYKKDAEVMDPDEVSKVSDALLSISAVILETPSEIFE